MLKIGDHPVEGLGELPQFIGSVYRYSSIKIARGDNRGFRLKTPDRIEYVLKTEPDSQKHGKESSHRKYPHGDTGENMKVSKSLFQGLFHDNAPACQGDDSFRTPYRFIV